MWWIALTVGVAGVAIGVRQLVLAFAGGAERGRGLTATGPAIQLVRAAMYVTGGLFLAFIGLANLVALQAAAP
jgi:hypothetical protein